MALTDQAIKEIQDYIQVQGLAWAKDFIAGRVAWLNSKGISVTDELVQSLQQEVTSTLEQAAITKIEIAFKPYGRYLEMRNLNAPAGGQGYIDALEQWIEDRGLRQRFTNRFLETRNRRTAPENILNQLAWSVARSRHERVKRRRSWYNKPKQASITELYNRVAGGLPELVAREIKNALTNG